MWNQLAESAPVLSIAIAAASVIYSRRSAAAAGVAVRKAEADFRSTLREARPLLDMEIHEVEYRWVVGNRRGTATEPAAEEERSLAELEEEGVEGEVYVRGLLRVGHSQLLLTKHDHERTGRDVWYPLQNHSVLRLGVRPERTGQSRAVAAANSEIPFEWVDRRPVRAWAVIESVTGRNFWNDPELRLPKLSWQQRIKHWSEWMSPGYPRFLQEAAVPRSGFRLVAETRGHERVPIVWFVEVVETPLQVWGRNDDDVLVWRCRPRTTAPVDDDQVMYRYGFDNNLARLLPWRHRFVPGRF